MLGCSGHISTQSSKKCNWWGLEYTYIHFLKIMYCMKYLEYSCWTLQDPMNLIEIFTYSFKNIQAMNWKRNDWKHSYIPFQKEVCVLCAIRIIISSTHMQGSSVLKSHMHWNTHHHFHPSSHTHCCTYPVITRPPGMALPALCLTSGVNSTPLTPLSNIITHTALCWVQRTGAFIAPGLLAFTC